METSSITCQACKAKNAPYSKYCFNCGTRLPSASHIVCPNCQRLNPSDRYYCDECGVRLVDEGQAPGTGGLSQEDTVVSNLEAFSLPARQPGDTGILDPASLLDRMKTGDLPPEAQAGADEPEALPDASELISRKAPTADLPEWLVDEYDSDPIIDAPSSISTDDYLEMLGQAKGEDGTAVDEAGAPAEQIELPDWLSDAQRARRKDAAGADQEATDADLSRWLAELSETAMGEPFQEAAEPYTDWMAELGPADTDLLSKPVEGERAQTGEFASERGSLPDWLGELGPPDTSLLSVPSDPGSASSGDRPYAEDEPSDWMADLGPPDTEFLSTPSSSKPVTPEEDELSDDLSSDWMAELGPPDTNLLSVSSVSEAIQEGEEEPRGEESSDWLAELGRPDTDLLSVRAGLKDTPSDDELADVPTLDWMAELGPPDTSFLQDTAEAIEEAASDLAWFADTSEEPSFKPETEGAPALLAADMLDQDVTPGLEPGDVDEDEIAEGVVGEGELLPAWLMDYEEDKADIESGQAGELPETAIEQLDERQELPQWLIDADQTRDEEVAAAGSGADEGAAFDLGSREDYLPAWLAEADQGDDAEAVQWAQPEDESALGTADELPDWLAIDEDLDWTQDEERASTLDQAAIAGDVDHMGASDWPGDLPPDGVPAAMQSPETSSQYEKFGGVIDELPAWLEEAESSELEAQSEEGWPETIELADSIDDLEPRLSDVGESVENVESIADLFADIEAPEAFEDVQPLPGSLRELFEDEEFAQDTELEWMTAPLVMPADFKEAESVESLEAVEEAEAVETEITAPTEADEESDEAADQTLLEEPDWLTELASLGVDGMAGEETGELAEIAFEAEQTPAPPGMAESADVEHDELVEAAISESQQLPGDLPDDDWLEAGSFLDDLAPIEAMPDWLGELGPPAAGQPAESAVVDELISSGELPEWVAGLKPEADSETESLLPSALSPALDDEDAFVDLSDDLGAAELPAWLQSEAADSDAVFKTPALLSALTPDIFRKDRLEPESGIGPATGDLSALDSDWGDLLSVLQPSRRPDEDLVRAEIPDWLQQLKPRELIEHGTEAGLMLPAVVTGPLAGLRGVIGIEPIIDLPHTAGSVGAFTVTKEQQQQAALLRRLTQWEIRPAIVSVRPESSSPAWLRALLAIMLFLAVIVGLSIPDLLLNQPTALTLQTREAGEAIDAAAGRTVIVAIEYTPAYAGELMPQTLVLLQRLEENGSPILTVSQSAAGAAIAAGLMSEREGQDLGYMPGEAIALRQLADCLFSSPICSRLLGREIDAELQQALGDVALVVVITGDRDSLTPWIEQVAAAGDIPVIAGITQAIGPIARPYVASGQLQGLMEGLDDAAAFQDAFLQEEVATGLPARLGALQVVQLLMAAIMLVGAIVYGIIGGASRQSGSKKGTT
jgi:hypothetical protein